MVRTCSVLPEHVHVVVARHHYHVEQVVNVLKGAATRSLVREDLHPLANHATRKGRPPSPWGRGEWKVFLNTPADVERAIRCVENNPIKEGYPPQTRSFVTKLDDLV